MIYSRFESSREFFGFLTEVHIKVHTLLSLMNQTLISKNKFTNLTMIDVAKLSAKGQIVIPGDIRKKLRIKQGSKLVLRQMGHKLIIIPERDFEAELLAQEKEDLGWQMLAEKSLAEVWEDETDEEWSQYL